MFADIEALESERTTLIESSASMRYSRDLQASLIRLRKIEASLAPLKKKGGNIPRRNRINLCQIKIKTKRAAQIIGRAKSADTNRKRVKSLSSAATNGTHRVSTV